MADSTPVRSVATALILANWRGVFYERYRLDRHVTALEGANGAGKTTVMVAAYVALFPDLSRLRFVNVGETGSTGGDRGLYGRLGEDGPAYCALEICVAGTKRVLAGVYIERRTHPSLTLSPFLVTDLPLDTEVPWLLHTDAEHEEILPFSELARHFGARGASFQRCGSAKEYFATLFDWGVLPLRLQNDEDRNKFNDMLRTSMTGGISRALTSELRSFLFREQSGLFDALSRIRSNLSACRKTRIEVAEARALEGEISGVYESGQAMVQHALLAAEARLGHLMDAVVAAQGSERELLSRSRQLRSELTTLTSTQGALDERSRLVEQQAERSAAQVSDLRRLRGLAEQLAKVRDERRSLSQSHEAAVRERERAQMQRNIAREARTNAMLALKNAAQGLADLQQGLDELHRRSHAQKRARQVAVQLKQELGISVAQVGDLEPARERMREVLEQLESEWHASEQALLTGERRQDDVQRVEEALSQLQELWPEGQLPQGEPLSERARAALIALQELHASARQLSELEHELVQTQAALRNRQQLEQALRFANISAGTRACDVLEEVGQLREGVRTLSEEVANRKSEAEALAERAELAARALTSLRRKQQQYRSAQELRGAIRSLGGEAPERRAELLGEIVACGERERELRQRQQSLRNERLQLEQQARNDESLEATTDDRLCQLSELLGGQPLAERYELLSPEEARQVQARLGPWLEAVVVEDPRKAAVKVPPSALQGEQELRLVASDFEPPAIVAGTSPDRMEGGAEPDTPWLAVEEGLGVVMRRWPARLVLGRAARLERARQARERASQLSMEERALSAEQAKLTELALALRAFHECIDVAEAGDPAQELEEQEAHHRRFVEESEDRKQQSWKAQERLCPLLEQLAAVESVLGHVHLLDEIDLAERAARAQQRCGLARVASARSEQLLAIRGCLMQRAHLLEDATEDEPIDKVRKRCLDLRQRLGRMRVLSEELRFLEAEPSVLRSEDAVSQLEERQALVPTLSEQHNAAQASFEEAEHRCSQAEVAWEESVACVQGMASQLSAVEAQIERLSAELPGPREASDLDAQLRQESESHERALANAQELKAKQQQLLAAVALAGERLARVEEQLEAARAHSVQLANRLQPVQEAHSELLELAKALAVAAPTTRDSKPAEQRAADGWAQAESSRRVVLERLRNARGGEGFREELEAAWEGATEDAAAYLRLWQNVREWLTRRLPVPLADAQHAGQGLDMLRRDLQQLESRLEQQEEQLMGTSTDIASSIDVRVRRAFAQVRRINQHLEGVGFGSVRGIRIRAERAEKMQRVLEALRSGKTQELLFHTELPIEEALDEIFKRYGGGKGGGGRLVDFREYMDLSVEAQRRTSDDFAVVHPSQVSTGEAIGIGAALMMVILAQWEREANLLRKNVGAACVRFLFLDEANRLSQDNLGVLFDLCRSLDLQLLIAAPEVARADGNTTYRLVRKVDEEGREEVLVSGRRKPLTNDALPITETDDRAPDTAEEASPAEAQLPPKPTQGELLL